MKNTITVIDGDAYITVTRVFCGWSVTDRTGNKFVPIGRLPIAFTTAGLEDFVEGRAVVGAVADIARGVENRHASQNKS